MAESFFATLKKELPDGRVFTNLAEGERYLFEYIEIDYNRQHPHSTLGYQSPEEYEEQYWLTTSADHTEAA